MEDSVLGLMATAAWALESGFFFSFSFLALLHGVQDLSSSLRDRTLARCSGSTEP